MKAWLATLFTTVTFTTRLVAQPHSTDASTTTTPSATTSYPNPAVVISEPQLVRKDEIVGKQFKVTGFLVRPFKAMRLHKAGGAVASLFQAINPFSREKTSAQDARFEGELSTVAWSSSIGWRVGGSSFANPVTHEVGLTALSISR